MNLGEIYNVLVIPVIATALYYYCNFKKSKALTTMNEYLLFKKYIFNRKLDIPAGEKTAVSFFFFFSWAVINAPNGFFGVDLIYGKNKSDFFSKVLTFLILLFIIRFIYEFLVIPHLHKGALQNTYQENMQNINITTNFKFCSQCGMRYPIDDVICPNCGKQ